MDLYHHTNPPFTEWIIGNDLLMDKFTVIDAGCQGGPHPRWQMLGDLVDFHGFDPIGEVIQRLKSEYHDRPNFHFYEVALGSENGQRTFNIGADSFSSSFYATNPAGDSQGLRGDGIIRGERIVEVRTLDSLMSERCVPLADFIKMDCEGFETEILAGAKRYLAASSPIGVTSETNFNVSPIHPRTHFSSINDLLLPHRLLMFDLSFRRSPSRSYLAVRSDADDATLRGIWTLDVVGRPTEFDFLFCRDLVGERDWPQQYINKPLPYVPPQVDTVIKAMILFELHGLMDCALELGVQFRSLLEQKLDVSRAIDLLLMPAPNPRSYSDRLP